MPSTSTKLIKRLSLLILGPNGHLLCRSTMVPTVIGAWALRRCCKWSSVSCVVLLNRRQHQRQSGPKRQLWRWTRRHLVCYSRDTIIVGWLPIWMTGVPKRAAYRQHSLFFSLSIYVCVSFSFSTSWVRYEAAPSMCDAREEKVRRGGRAIS